MENKVVFAAVQNGCILEVFDTKEEACDRIQDEIKRDFVSIMLKRKLRKLFAKSGDVALHQYTVLTITEVERIK